MKKINFKRICASVLAGTMLTGFGLNTNALADNNQRIEKFLLTEEEQNDPNYSYMINDDYENLFTEEEVLTYNRLIKSILDQEWFYPMDENDERNMLIGEAIYHSPYNMLLEAVGYDPDVNEMVFYYLFDQNEQNQNLSFVQTEMERIREELFEDDMSTLDKLIVLFDYMTHHYAYTMIYPKQFILENGTTLKIPLYYLLKYRNGVCHTFSYFIDYFCQLEGIESYLITGYLGKTGHMWNMVRLDDGELYMFDATTALTKGKPLNNIYICFGITKQEYEMYSFSNPKKYRPLSFRMQHIKTLPSEFRGYMSAEYLGNHIFKMTKQSGIVYLNTETREVGNTIEEVTGKGLVR